MNVYLSNLSVWNTKLHNIHWNVVGLQFMPVHKLTEELYNDAFEKLDQIAEQMKILGELPFSTTKEYLDNSTIEEIPARPFNIKESLEIVKEDMRKVKDQALTVRDAAEKDGDFGTVNIIEDHIADYDKNLWFLSSMIK